MFRREVLKRALGLPVVAAFGSTVAVTSASESDDDLALAADRIIPAFRGDGTRLTRAELEILN